MQSPEADLITRTKIEFSSLWQSEEDCAAFFFHHRWPQGFSCPTCNQVSSSVYPARHLLCPKCGNQSSLTTGTLMHGTKKSLRQWLLAIWWLSANDRGSSARELQRLLHLSSYQTAWTWLQKLRLSIAQADREPCRGVVELGCSEITPAWEGKEQALVLTAAECIMPTGITGRIRMCHITECTAKTMLHFLQSTVTANSSLIAPGYAPFDRLEDTRYGYIIDSKTTIPQRIEEINRSFEIWLNKIHRGGVGLKHLQLYLDEFCFHSNASLMVDRKAVFTALVQGVLQATPRPYKEIIHSGSGGSTR